MYKKYHKFIFSSAINYGITWIKDTSANYKFFHKTNSILVPSMKNKDNPWRYPFADVFIYKYDERFDILAYENKWKDLKPGVGFDAKLKWPNGTKLTRFGNFEMRVSTDNINYLQRLFGNYSGWQEIGITPWYNHYKNVLGHEVAFKIPEILYSPYNIFPAFLVGCTCDEIVL